MKTISDVDQTLQHIKAALIYKGIDFGIVFAEAQEDETGQNLKGRSRSKTAALDKYKKEDGKIDLMCHYSRFAQQIVK